MGKDRVVQFPRFVVRHVLGLVHALACKVSKRQNSVVIATYAKKLNPTFVSAGVFVQNATKSVDEKGVFRSRVGLVALRGVIGQGAVRRRLYREQSNQFVANQLFVGRI